MAQRPEISNPKLPRVLAFLQRLDLPLVLLLIAFWTWRPLQGGEDFWSHIAVGRWIWENQSVPTQTLWIWSVPPQDWIAHSWLGQLLFYALMQLGGPHLVLLATVVFVATPFLLFWKLWDRRGGVNAFTPVFFAFAIWCAAVRFQPRPELFTYFFLGWLLLFLCQWPRGATKLKGVAVIAMFALWANLHGAVALGLLLLLLTAVAELLQQRFAKPAWRLPALTLACALAVNVNPYGIAYWQSVRPVGGEMFKLIDEWKPPLTAPAMPIEAVLFVAIVVLIAFFAWARNPERRWAQLAWLLLGSVLFLTARRNLWPCMLISVAVAAANAGAFAALRFPAVSSEVRVLARSMAVACLVFWLVIAFPREAFSTRAGESLVRATSEYLPRGVADYVQQHRPPEPAFNDYLRSGYFHWRFNGAPPLYIDVQNVYPPALLRNYFDIVLRTGTGPEQLEELKVNTVIFGRYRSTDRIATLAAYLDASPQWHNVYRGADGAVWVRRVPLALLP